MLSRARLFATPWTAVHQAPLSVGFSRQEYWSRLPFPSPGDLPIPGIKPTPPVSPALQADSLLSHRGTSREVMGVEVSHSEEQSVNANQPLLTVISRQTQGPWAGPVNLSAWPCSIQWKWVVTVPFLSSVPSKAQDVLVLRSSQSGTRALREPGHSYPPGFLGLGTQGPCPTACWGAGCPSCTFPWAEEYHGLAGEAEARLRAKGACSLRFIGAAGCHSWSPSPDGGAPSSRDQGGTGVGS